MYTKLLNLTWVIHIPRLQSLDMGACDSLEALIEDDKSKVSEIEQELGLLSKLMTLNLYNLPNLQSICKQALPFPSMSSILVAFCPSLRKLPLNSITCTKRSLQKINGEQQWWDALVWEDENINIILTTFILPCGNMAPSAYAT